MPENMIDSKGLKMTLPLAQLTTRTGALDFLLAEIVSTLQLTDTQIARVESAYPVLCQNTDDAYAALR